MLYGYCLLLGSGPSDGASVISLSLNIVYEFCDVSCDWQAFVCQNKRLKREFLFMQSKRKQSGINNKSAFLQYILTK